MNKDITQRKKEIEDREKEKQKLTVVSKGPIRRLRSVIPTIENMKKRANSIAPLTPIFTHIMKS